MQVNLPPMSHATLVGQRLGAVPLSVRDSPLAPLAHDSQDELRERVRRDEEQAARAEAALVPTRPADVINCAERNMETSSRAFRRQVARDGAVQDFRENRQAFREALAGTRQKGAHATSRNPVGAETRPAAKPRARADAEPQAATRSQASSRAGIAPSKTAAASGAAHLRVGHLSDPSSAPARAPACTGRGVTPNALPPQTLRVPTTGLTATRAVQSGAAAGRAASSAPLSAARPGGSTGPKAGGPTPAGAGTTRSPTKAGASAAVKASAARSAENAAREANVERIVRVIRSRINGHRSHTVMRLDPPELGSLRLQLDLRGPALTLRIDTSTAVAHRLLSEDVNKLRDGLEALGIRLEQVEVRPPTQAPQLDEHGASQHADQHSQAQGESAHADAEHPQERGTESHPAESTDGSTRGSDAEPAAESLVNLVA